MKKDAALQKKRPAFCRSKKKIENIFYSTLLATTIFFFFLTGCLTGVDFFRLVDDTLVALEAFTFFVSLQQVGVEGQHTAGLHSFLGVQQD